METRAIKFNLAEAHMDDDTGEFEGYASVFNRLIPGYNEIVAPGAFKKTLQENHGNVRILFNHWPNDWLGMGLEAVEDKKGLKIRGKILVEDIPVARQAWALMKLSRDVGAPAGLSIGFGTIKESKIKFKGIENVRKLDELALSEYSITPFPASKGALVTNVRSIVRAISGLDDMEIADLSAALRTDSPARNTDEGPDLHPIADALNSALELL